jgi:hypothetical protein
MSSVNPLLIEAGGMKGRLENSWYTNMGTLEIFSSAYGAFWPP